MNYISVVVTFNRKNLLLESITSLLAQKELPQKIVIIDNYSTDGTKKLLIDNGYLDNDRIIYRRLSENLGGSGGFYEGIKLALDYHPDWISLSDDDAVFNNDYFSKINAARAKHPGTLAYSGRVNLSDGRLQYDQRSRVTNWKWIRTQNISEEMYKQDHFIDVFTFCGCLINADLIKKIGLPDKDYFIWFDDIEYSLRIRKESKILNVHDAILTHKTKLPSIDLVDKYVPDWRQYYGIRNRLITIKRHSQAKGVLPLYFTYLIVKFYLLIASPKYKGNRKFVFHVYNRAFSDGLLSREGKSKVYLPGMKY